ncbi:MAG: hypothetical protein AUJ52_12445 [Elusimicrobia bacterium CG1_02_63_36]|nr:MAG: hypothetical protein AUJ52_12445 [Elusimicrobia bacterium CG1_02_63_36]PIP83003.1 MAG: hypothetical protein COR54_11900 [Elusimicrobia bacterium CG22_combo_CG10-13_8_21_14_all_63_91]PJA17496.1 MAG: hypothetical protein COX66_04430 [Elusimicrobia bacterium CG_4_10_14_0_2_um_filter_63_34]PJB25432.1 MAG: hypothetical protein CO113_08530 [Elusimicrobia bacterium CG_4_9_14_3_um_filter_62_55]
MKIPYVDLPAQHAPLKAELLAALEGVLDRGDFILGGAVAEFEKRLAEYCGTKNAIGLNSGTDALFLVMKAYSIGPGDEVITAPNSFLASASTIIAAGATPVFADIRPDLNIDPAEVAKAITPRTKAIMPVHLTGRPADMDPLRALAKNHGLKIIEDAAQAIGAEYRGVKSGALGDAGCFSLHPLKTLNACGDAGAVTTDDDALREALVELRNIGLKNRNESRRWGFNSRLDTMQAAVLNVKLNHLENWTRRRIANARRYCDGLRGVVAVPEPMSDARCVYHTFVIQTDRRDELQSALDADGIGTGIHYPIPIHLQETAAPLGFKKGGFPVCEAASGRMLSLPVHQGLSDADIDFVIARIEAFFSRVGAT